MSVVLWDMQSLEERGAKRLFANNLKKIGRENDSLKFLSRDLRDGTVVGVVAPETNDAVSRAGTVTVYA